MRDHLPYFAALVLLVLLALNFLGGESKRVAKQLESLQKSRDAAREILRRPQTPLEQR